MRPKSDWSDDWSNGYAERMRTIGATEFKAKCLQLLDEVDAEGITITKHGKPVAKLVPASAPMDEIRAMYGKYKDKIEVHGDLLSTGRKWNAQR